MSSRSTLTAPRSSQLTADQWWTLGLASIGSFLVILDLFAVSTALPTLRAFGTTRSELVKVLRATKERAQAGEPALEGLAAGVEARRDRAHAA